jgi:hypothetical protein
MQRTVNEIYGAERAVRIEGCKLLIVFSSIRFQLLVTTAITLSCYGV